jgi:hypothetical protein
LLLGGADNQEELTMKRIVAIAVAAAFLAFPPAVQSANKGKGHTGLTPGHEAKDLAPGHEAKDLAQGTAQRKKK